MTDAALEAFAARVRALPVTRPEDVRTRERLLGVCSRALAGDVEARGKVARWVAMGLFASAGSSAG